MKKLIAAAAAIILTAGLCGCSGSSGAVGAVISEQENDSVVTAAGLSLTIPQEWEVYAGEDVYKVLFENSGAGFDSADDLKESYNSAGISYLMYAANSDQTAFMTFTAMKITTDEAGQRSTAEEFARSNHDTGVISYQANGFPISGSSFTAETLGGKSGWLSKYEVFSDEDEPQLIMGQAEFIFEQDGCFYSLQSYYHSEEAGEQTADILAGITAV